MSIHKSLKLKSALVRTRSVLTRWERIERLRDQDRWHDGDAVVGLPKVRTKFKLRTKRAAPGTEPAAGAAAAPAAKGAAPAAKGAAPAKAAAPAAKAAAPAKKK